MGMGFLLGAPSQELELPEHGEDESEAAQEDNEAHGAPEIGRRRRGVPGLRIVGPVVGVGVVRSGAKGRCGPGCPGKVGVEIPQLSVVLDEAPGQAGGRCGAGEIGPPLLLLGAEGGRLHRREPKRPRCRVVAVLLELAFQGFADLDAPGPHRGPRRSFRTLPGPGCPDRFPPCDGGTRRSSRAPGRPHAPRASRVP